jgi:hypothetical protein
MMIFVFSIGMLKQYMPKREVLLVLAVAFLIGSIGGAFFLDPIYDELPSMVGMVEKNMPNNEETLYLDLSSLSLLIFYFVYFQILCYEGLIFVKFYIH